MAGLATKKMYSTSTTEEATGSTSSCSQRTRPIRLPPPGYEPATLRSPFSHGLPGPIRSRHACRVVAWHVYATTQLDVGGKDLHSELAAYRADPMCLNGSSKDPPPPIWLKILSGPSRILDTCPPTRSGWAPHQFDAEGRRRNSASSRSIQNYAITNTNGPFSAQWRLGLRESAQYRAY